MGSSKQRSSPSQSRFFKARDIARHVVKTKADLLVTLYRDKKDPKTHKEIWKELVLPDYPDVALNRMSSIISMAIKEVLTEKQYEKLRKWRKDHFDALHGVTVGHKNLKKFLKKARANRDTSTWGALRQAEMEERWLSPRYDDEISYLYTLLHTAKYKRKHAPYKGHPDYAKIAKRLNVKFYEWKEIRTRDTVSSFAHKHDVINTPPVDKKK